MYNIFVLLSSINVRVACNKLITTRRSFITSLIFYKRMSIYTKAYEKQKPRNISLHPTERPITILLIILDNKKKNKYLASNSARHNYAIKNRNRFFLSISNAVVTYFTQRNFIIFTRKIMKRPSYSPLSVVCRSYFL